MIAASRLFVIMGLFGLVAGTTYLVWDVHQTHHAEFAGYVLLDFFFIACVFIGVMLWMASPNNKRRAPAPDTGLPGSAHPTRGARNEQGHIHAIAPTIAPAAYSLAVFLLLLAFVYRDKLHVGTAGVAGIGLILFLAATTIWYRAASADARAKIRGYQHEEHRAQIEAARNGQTPEPLGPANYFEQIREAMEVGDPDWAAQAYAPNAVYYEPANPPHEGRDAIRAYLNDLMKAHRDLRYTVERMGTNDDSAIVEWTWSFRGRDNRRVTGQAGATVLQIGPDGIVYHRDYL